MESLFATYASSDDESDDNHQPPPRQPPVTQQAPPSKSLFSSLPNPQSSSSSRLFSSLPPPKPSSLDPPTKPSSLFSLLPPPTTQFTPLSNPNPNPKKVVQFHPPQFNKDTAFSDDDEDEEEERERKKKRQLAHENATVKSFLSTIPAPKKSGSAALGGALGGRRSAIDAPAPAAVIPSPAPAVSAPVAEVGIEQNIGGQVVLDDGSLLGNYDVTGYGNYEGYSGYESYGQQYYDESSINVSVSAGETVSGTSSGVDGAFYNMRGSGKRRKDEIPTQIVEVKQDELMKNRPTEDKANLTGMAFGPSYQPTSSKGKPSKLHKRKHQISALYFDMRQQERELRERRAKGFLTKSETQAKYGW